MIERESGKKTQIHFPQVFYQSFHIVSGLKDAEEIIAIFHLLTSIQPIEYLSLSMKIHATSILICTQNLECSFYAGFNVCV